MFKKIISKLSFGSCKNKNDKDVDASKEYLTTHEDKNECCSTETKYEGKSE
jgi:hypothetical protein